MSFVFRRFSRVGWTAALGVLCVIGVGLLAQLVAVDEMKVSYQLPVGWNDEAGVLCVMGWYFGDQASASEFSSLSVDRASRMPDFDLSQPGRVVVPAVRRWWSRTKKVLPVSIGVAVAMEDGSLVCTLVDLHDIQDAGSILLINEDGKAFLAGKEDF